MERLETPGFGNSESPVFQLHPPPEVIRSVRAGLKPMQPMQLHWAPRGGGWVWLFIFASNSCARKM